MVQNGWQREVGGQAIWFFLSFVRRLSCCVWGISSLKSLRESCLDGQRQVDMQSGVQERDLFCDDGYIPEGECDTRKEPQY